MRALQPIEAFESPTEAPAALDYCRVPVQRQLVGIDSWKHELVGNTSQRRRMGKRQSKSITQKLQSLILSALFGALLVMLSTTMVSDFITYRQDLIENLSSIARTIDANMGTAIVQRDSDFASRILVTISTEQGVLRALIVLRNGDVFAEYSVDLHAAQSIPQFSPSFWEDLTDTRVTFHLRHVELLAPILHKNETVGAILIDASPASLYQKLFWKLLVTALQLTAAIVLALVISARIRRQISQPITALAKAMERVSNEQDYSVVVRKRDDDEIGGLIDGFNYMLDQIRQRDGRLADLATRDSLTGCLNRRAFFDAFEPLFVAARAETRPLGCIMADIDHFKSVNDRYGHQVGDEAIKLIAKILAQNTRPQDLLCRYGGEEFCLVLPGLSIDAAARIGERLRKATQAVAGHGLRSAEGLTITCSFGVAALGPGSGSAEILIDQADQALYTSKNSGRNRVTQYTEIDGTECYSNETGGAETGRG